jgi:hypothetical protein
MQRMTNRIIFNEKNTLYYGQESISTISEEKEIYALSQLKDITHIKQDDGKILLIFSYKDVFTDKFLELKQKMWRWDQQLSSRQGKKFYMSLDIISRALNAFEQKFGLKGDTPEEAAARAEFRRSPPWKNFKRDRIKKIPYCEECGITLEENQNWCRENSWYYCKHEDGYEEGIDFFLQVDHIDESVPYDDLTFENYRNVCRCCHLFTSVGSSHRNKMYKALMMYGYTDRNLLRKISNLIKPPQDKDKKNYL